MEENVTSRTDETLDMPMTGRITRCFRYRMRSGMAANNRNAYGVAKLNMFFYRCGLLYQLSDKIKIVAHLDISGRMSGKFNRIR